MDGKKGIAANFDYAREGVNSTQKILLGYVIESALLGGGTRGEPLDFIWGEPLQ